MGLVPLRDGYSGYWLAFAGMVSLFPSMLAVDSVIQPSQFSRLAQL